MKYCIHCGAEMEDIAAVCPKCGTPTQAQVEDKPDTAMNVLAFFIPLVGLILYLVYRDRQPRRAKGIGKFALIGLSVGIVIALVATGIFGSQWQRQREIAAARADADRSAKQAEESRRQLEELNRDIDDARRAIEDYYG